MNIFKRSMICVLISILTQMVFTGVVCAESRDYTLDGSKRIPIPETYILKEVISYPGSADGKYEQLNGAEDLFINKQGYIFVADTGNGRILKLTKDGKITGIFKGPDEKPLLTPCGIFADDDGNMYIADTGNSRVVHLSADGEFVEEFLRPDSELLSNNESFNPTKICLTPTGYIYVIKGQSILTIDAYGRFRGYLGQTKIGFKLLDVILRRFTTDEQKRAVIKRTGAVYLNIVLDKDGTIYATTLDMAEGEIKKLSSTGYNIYMKYEDLNDGFKLIDLSSLSSINLAGTSFVYGERTNDEGMPINPYLADITVDRNGIVTTVDENTGKLYQYDQEGNLLTVFGGKSDQKGCFDTPSSIVSDDDGNIYVLDKVRNNIQVFEPTRFIKLVHKAVSHYYNGEYEIAFDVWKEVLLIDENYVLAHAGMAKTLFKQRNWKESMNEYILANDRANYSEAFQKYRHDIFRKYFVLVILGFILSIVLLNLVAGKIRKISEKGINEFRESRPERMRTTNMLKLSLATVYNPVETFEAIKSNRERLNYIPSLVILAAVIAVRIFYIYTVHFPLASIDPKDANIWLETAIIFIPFITWVIASFAITAIMDGESKLSEIFVASSYCMVPYILINIPLPLLSNILERDEAGIYGLISNAVLIWVLILIFKSVRSLNGYHLAKTVGICTISLITMALICGITLLVFILTAQFYEFIAGIIREIQMILV